MRIGIELRLIIPEACGGIVPLLQGVLGAVFANHPDCQCDLFCIEANAGLFRSLPPHVRLDVLGTDNYFPDLDRLAAERRLDVLFRSYPWDTPLGYPAERQVFLVPDLQHDFFADFFDPTILQKRRSSFNKALAEAGAIATLSEHGRRTILEHPATRCTDIFLMHPALPAESTDPVPLTAEEKGQVPVGDYFLYPANLWPHKNHHRLLQAFALLLQQSSRPFELVLTGHPDGWPALAAEFASLPVRHLGFVRRPLLEQLLRRARAVAFFSLFEGFGMPLLEAFAAGVPVACSNTTSLPEVGGDAVLACDPTDVKAISAALARVACDEGLRRTLVERGRTRLSLYRWEHSAARLVAACERVVRRSTTEVAGQSVRRLHQLLRESEADRALRLDAINRLITESAGRLEVINYLDREGSLRLEALHRLDSLFKQSEEDRLAQHALVQHLFGELHSTRALCRRLVRRVLGKAWRAARGAARMARGKIRRQAG
jgi:glycosyltransferase involved in cell wall biosynthesis